VEDGLDVLSLPHFSTVGFFDGEGDEVVPVIPLESSWDHVGLGAIASFVQREARGGGCIRGLLWVVRIFEDLNEWVLSWV